MSARAHVLGATSVVMLACATEAIEAIEAIEATRLPVSAPAPCIRASAGRCPLCSGLEVVRVELGVVSCYCGY